MLRDDEDELNRRWQEWIGRRNRLWRRVVMPLGIAAVVFMVIDLLVSGQGFALFVWSNALIVMFAIVCYISFTRPANAAVQREHLDGAKVERLHRPQSDTGVPVGLARMPERVEPLHTLIEGATGTGKTQLLKQMVAFLRGRGDTVVVVDTGYDLHKAFGRPDDIVLSVFDPSAPGWLPQNEVRTPSDWSALAQSFIGDGKGEARQWHEMAKALFAAVARGYQRAVEEANEPFDHRELFHLLTGADADTLAPFVKGTAAASLGSNDKALNNVRMTFFQSLKFWELLRPGGFSVREWVDLGRDRPSIFIPYTKRQLPESKNLVSCWLDQIIVTACDRGEDRQNRVWLIIDELSGLGEIPSLRTATAELRKTGFRLVVGIQNYEQVEEIYGDKGAASITDNLSNKVVLRATNPASAERQSKLIGDARNRLWQRSTSVSRGEKASTSISTSAHDMVERIVLPAEVMALPDLTAFVKFAGSDTAYLTPIPVYQPKESENEVEMPAVLPHPASPPSVPSPEAVALQSALRTSDPITARNTGGEGLQTWSKVDELLKSIGGEGWDGDRFRTQVIQRLGWMRGQTHEKFALAHERARQLLLQTLDRAEIERETKEPRQD